MWRHLYLERSQSVQYFAQQFSFATRKCWTALWVKRESEQVQLANVFKRQTLVFHFLTYRPISCKHYPITLRFDRMSESTSAIVLEFS